MKTLKEQETEAFLSIAEALKAKTQECSDLQYRLNSALEQIRSLEAQVYNGSTK